MELRTDEHFALVDLVQAKIIRTYDAHEGPKARRIADRMDSWHTFPATKPRPDIRYVAVHIQASEN